MNQGLQSNWVIFRLNEILGYIFKNKGGNNRRAVLLTRLPPQWKWWVVKVFYPYSLLLALCTGGAWLLKSRDSLPITDFFVARKMKDFPLSQYPINVVVILWVSTLAKRYVSNQATACDSDSIFFQLICTINA